MNFVSKHVSAIEKGQFCQHAMGMVYAKNVSTMLLVRSVINAMRTSLDFPIVDIVSINSIIQLSSISAFYIFFLSFTVDEDEKEELLFKSIEADDLPTIKALIRLNTDIDSREPEHNETSLMQAVRHGQCGIARWFLEKGADVSLVNEFESTALHIAAQIGKVECLQDLISYNADINKIDDWGYTPLDIAKYRDKKYAFSYLTSRGAKCKKCCYRRFGVPC